MPELWAAIAADSYQDEFEKELSWRGLKALSSREGFYLFEGEPQELFWSAARWLDVERLEISSISSAAKALRPLARRWFIHSVGNHRRASLIADSLRMLPKQSCEFPLESMEGLGAFTLWEPNEVLWCKRFDRFHPQGLAPFAESLQAPSRAYLKLWEALSLHPERIKSGQRCLELGASPGGWTWVLAKLGASVLAVDRSTLAPEIMQMPNVEFRSGNAFSLTPELIGPVDWLCSDLICYPEKLFEYLAQWNAGKAKHFVCTIKFQGEAKPEVAAKFLEYGGRVLHLHHNKHELTWLK